MNPVTGRPCDCHVNELGFGVVCGWKGDRPEPVPERAKVQDYPNLRKLAQAQASWAGYPSGKLAEGLTVANERRVGEALLAALDALTVLGEGDSATDRLDALEQEAADGE